MTFVFQLANAADTMPQWGVNVALRDKELRNFWPTESYLAGAVANVCFRDSVFDWEIQGLSDPVKDAVTQMLETAIAGDMMGWIPFIEKFSQDLYTQDNGGFIEPIRDPGIDANSKFKGPMAPVIGVAHLDSNQCVRTGNPEFPVIYTDRNGEKHKLAWYEVIPFSDLPSPIEKMNGVGYSAVSRILRISQIMRSIAIFKDEEVGGRNVKKVQIVGGVGKKQLDDAIQRANEQANNKGFSKFIEHAILAGLDPEKPVSVAELELASLPEGFDFDQEMQWYISGLALGFGVDYQEFAPLPGGNIGSASQSMVLHRKSSGKGPRKWMDMISSAFKVYGVIPRGGELVFNDKNNQDEIEKEEIKRTAYEGAAIAANARLVPRKNLYEDLVKRGILQDLGDIPEDFWKEDLEPTASNLNRGGNTVAEGAGRVASGEQKPTAGARLRKFFRVD